jgi:putative ABC transport system permease protein
VIMLLARNLLWYWRTNAAVAWGVATAVGVLAGALLVGESVRASLRDLVLSRLGRTDSVISGAGFFREKLASDLGATNTCPMIAFEGLVAHEASSRRVAGVQVYGVDERFWRFHGIEAKAPSARDILLSPSLARELEAKPGDAILVRVKKPSAIPAESLHGRKDDLGRTIRLVTRDVLARSALGEFSVRPLQGDVRAVFVPLRRLQRDLEQPGKVNTILVAAGLKKPLRDAYALEDAGIKLRLLEKQQCLSLESDSALIGDALADTARSKAGALGMRTESIFSYLANAIRSGGREIPYSLVTATDAPPSPDGPNSITLNEWAARDLNVRPGDVLSMDYYVWAGDGRLHTRTAQLQLAAVAPIEGAAADRDLTPEYPGITGAESLHDWDPPFPIDLGLIRPRDEEYWKRYRTTPKGFLALATGQQLWQTRFGKLTSIRVFPPAGMALESARESYGRALRSALDPARLGLVVFPARSQGLEASSGATDFGEYFVYFSFFLMAAALLLTGLFFRLGVEQRLREIGVLRAIGFSIPKIRAMFLGEGIVLAAVGTLAGIGGAVAYGGLIMLGLRTWWVEAVGTRLLALHLSPGTLALGAIGGVVTGLVSIAWTVRGLQPATPRNLLAGVPPARSRKVAPLGFASGVLGALLLAAAWRNWISQVAGFFGAGTLLLAALLCLQWTWLARNRARPLHGVPQLGFRNASYRPGRSILCIALIAAATFIIVAVDAFRRDTRASLDRKSGTGGFPLMAESVLPVIHNPNAEREALNLPALADVTFVRFRLRPGDDTSCLNLYQPRNPRILGASPDFIRSGRFSFQESLARTAEEKANPWLLLEAPANAQVVPAIADANSMTYALHLKLGDELVINQNRLRLVAALQDSLFQGELLISEKNFLRLFPDLEGYRFFLLDLPAQKSGEATSMLEEALADYGFDVRSTAERLAGFHRVENTYLSTFQTLGALGLLLGTLGLAAVLLRNVLERRRELALLRAVGYRPAKLALMVVAENVLLLVSGLAIGVFCALLAIAPALVSRGGRVAVVSMVLLLSLVLATGLIASLVATVAVVRSALLPALRAE